MKLILTKYLTPVILGIAAIVSSLGLVDLGEALKALNTTLVEFIVALWAVYELIRGIFLHKTEPPGK